MLNRKREITKIIVLSAILMVLQFSWVFMVWLTRPPTLKLFNLKTTVQEFSTQLAKANLTASEKQALTVRFTTALQVVVDDYSKQHRVILVNPSSVVSSLPDVTVAVQHAIARYLQDEKNG